MNRFLFSLSAAALLAGCGNSSEQTAGTNTTGELFSPSLQLLRLTPQNANDVSNTLLALEAQATSLVSGPFTGSNGTPMGIIQDLLLAYPTLSLPQPPSDKLMVSGNLVTFQNYETAAAPGDAVRLNGRVALEKGKVELQGLRVTPLPPAIPGLPATYQLDGIATLRQNPPNLAIGNDYGFNITVTDVANGGTARLENFTATAVGNVSATNQVGLLTTHGAIILDRFSGYTGQVTVTSPAPIGFSTTADGNPAVANATSGTVLFTGDGVLGVSVPSLNNVVISLNGAVVPAPSPASSP